MIRTRDFAVFSAVMVFFLSAIVMTVAGDLWGTNGQVAATVKFAEPGSVMGAVADNRKIDRAGNVERLKNKIAAGEGDSPEGAPVFTSVDETVPETPVITDTAPAATVMIGSTQDGSPLYSDNLWRFIGFSSSEQIGTAVNGKPIFGARADTLLLDACGGADDGTGYKLYLQTNREVPPSCFTN